MKGSLFLMPVLGAVLFTNPAEASLRKCSSVPFSSAPWVQTNGIMMIDGEVLGEMPDAGAAPNRASIAFKALPAESISSIEITCREFDTETGPAQSQVIAVLTKEGRARLTRQYLRELMDLQEAYRGLQGRYAATTNELKFFVRRTPLPLAISVTEFGWTASIELGRETCMVAGGSPDSAREVRCAPAT